MVFSKEWDKQYKSNQHMSVWPWTDLVALVMRYCKPQMGENRKVLELGCGAGANIPFFLNLEVDYFGVDGSRTVIQMLHEKYPKLRKNLLECDFTQNIPFQEKFDLVIDRAGLTCNSTGDIIKTIEQVKQIMPNGGRLVGVDWYSTMHTEYEWGDPIDDGYTRIFTDDRCEFKNVGKAHFFSKEHLLDILCDFEIIHLNHKTYTHYFTKPDGYQSCSWDFVAEIQK